MAVQEMHEIAECDGEREGESEWPERWSDDGIRPRRGTSPAVIYNEFSFAGWTGVSAFSPEQ